jgi:hypothetical protein
MIVKLKATAATSVIRFRAFIGCSFFGYLSLGSVLASRLDEANANGVEDMIAVRRLSTVVRAISRKLATSLLE